MECEKAQSQQNELQKKLVEADSRRCRDEERVRELDTENAKLRLDLATTKQRSKGRFHEHLQCMPA